MPSILELDEAQRRLQQIVDDRQQVVELIGKLKAIYEKAETKLSEISAHKEQSEKGLRSVETLNTKTTELVERCQRDANEAIKSIEGIGSKYVEEGEKLTTRINKDVVDLKTRLSSQCEATGSELESLSSNFKRQLLEDEKLWQQDYEMAKSTLSRQYGDTAKKIEDFLEIAQEMVAQENRSFRQEVTSRLETQQNSHEQALSNATSKLSSRIGDLSSSHDDHVQYYKELRSASDRLLQATADNKTGISGLRECLEDSRRQLEEILAEEINRVLDVTTRDRKQDIEIISDTLADALGTTQQELTSAIQKTRRRASMLMLLGWLSLGVPMVYLMYLEFSNGSHLQTRQQVQTQMSSDPASSVSGGLTENLKPGERLWTNREGNKIAATYLRIEEDMVVLRKPDGAVHKYPTEKLSDADRSYLEELSQQE